MLMGISGKPEDVERLRQDLSQRAASITMGWIVRMSDSDRARLRKAGYYGVDVAAACILDMEGWEASCIVAGYEGKAKAPDKRRWGVWRYNTPVDNITWQAERPDPTALWPDSQYNIYPGIFGD